MVRLATTLQRISVRGLFSNVFLLNQSASWLLTFIGTYNVIIAKNAPATTTFLSFIVTAASAVLKAGGSADVPTYDFTIHSRTKETKRYGETMASLRYIQLHSVVFASGAQCHYLFSCRSCGSSQREAQWWKDQECRGVYFGGFGENCIAKTSRRSAMKAARPCGATL